MYNHTLFVGGGGAAIWGATSLHQAAAQSADQSTGVTHFVREAFVAFPGQGPGFWILNVLAVIVGINTIIYALVAMWKLRPRRQQPLIDPVYEDYSPEGVLLAPPDG
jgi:hypothetical protein